MAGRWLEDGWKNTCCIRTPNTKQTVSTTQNNTAQLQNKIQNQMAGWLAVAISNIILM